jgi:hypothetical protein
VAEVAESELADATGEKQTANADGPPADFASENGEAEQKKDAT